MTTAPTPALLPCPFCGGPASAHEVNPKEAPGWVHLTVEHAPDCFYRVPKETLLLSAFDLERWNRRAELEARKPLPLSYRSGVMTSSIDGGATVSLHFNDMAEAEAWFVAITDQHDAGLVDKTVKLQDRQRFWGFFHSTCIYESDAELISLHATKAGAWRAMHRAQWLAWEEVRTLQMAGRREPGWKAYVHEASHIGLVEVQP